jgi:hypothetical protein
MSMKFVSLFIGFAVGVLILATAYRIATVDVESAAAVTTVSPPICVEFIPPCTTDSDCEGIN